MTTQNTSYNRPTLGGQPEFDFTVSHNENNVESQEFYDTNLDRFSNQCKKVYGLLKSGMRLTVRQALIDYNIGHLPRRIADLIELGIEVRSVRLKSGCKEYYLEAA